ncbi:PASTA domain-containing protein [Paludibacter jiangxiensis]|uniref:PASTA domain, binds beta-lactams n=1 Tax=Paludibacter jiangxiensis TaxID=681398 RepID=A0A161LE32_9BACT|nr:PASTA domain-containing protein [Paludibacter jiangxiensis]GAT62397.1 PASTA domain, binds beta-lactams [Paludibacter jiangxiensis]
MDKKHFSQFLGFIKGSLILKNVFYAATILVALLLFVLFMLQFYTHHGEAETVPNLCGLKLEDAAKLLDNRGMQYQVIDSVYKPDKAPGMVMEQSPIGGSKIKSYRSIYITINAKMPPGVALPDVRDLSLRHAQSLLESMGIKVMGVEYVPSEYSDLVRDIKYNGQTLTPGQKIPAGSGVILVVGRTSTDEDGNQLMPDVQSLSLEQATRLINSHMLSIGATNFDVEPTNEQDKANYIVYKQSPAANDSVPSGKAITLWLTKEKGKVATEEVSTPAPAPAKTTPAVAPKKEEKKKKKEDIEKFF